MTQAELNAMVVKLEGLHQRVDVHRTELDQHQKKIDDLAEKVSEFVGAVKLLAFILSASLVGQLVLQVVFHKQ